MKPWSCAGIGVVAPAATAFLTMSSTAALLSHERATITSVLLRASAIGFGVKVLKNGSTRSIT
jgi:hypothetical protein